MLHDEARHRTNRSQINLQEQRPAFGAPRVGSTCRHASVHGPLWPLIGRARRTASGGTAEREILPAVRPVHLELVNPGHRLATVGRTGDIQTDDARVDRRLDHMGRRPCIPGATDAPGSHERVFVCRFSQPLLHLVRRFSLADAVDEGRSSSARGGRAARYGTSPRDHDRKK